MTQHLQTHRVFFEKEVLTARQAYGLVIPVVANLDKDHLLENITSAEDIDGTGYCNYWAFWFRLNSRHQKVLLTITTEEPHFVLERYPSTERAASVCFQVKENRFNTYPDHSWQEVVARGDVLPVPFKDSPVVMQQIKHMMKLHEAPDERNGYIFDELSARVFSDGRLLWWLTAIPPDDKPLLPGETREYDLSQFYNYYVPFGLDGGEAFCVPILEDSLY